MSFEREKINMVENEKEKRSKVREPIGLTKCKRGTEKLKEDGRSRMGNLGGGRFCTTLQTTYFLGPEPCERTI
jgi:hypothetical protein